LHVHARWPAGWDSPTPAAANQVEETRNMNQVSGTSSKLDPLCAMLACVIRERRERLGLSKAELAREARISRSMVGLTSKLSGSINREAIDLSA
jgi:ribosome-binding protein aMBF1 (putative translation factor)